MLLNWFWILVKKLIWLLILCSFSGGDPLIVDTFDLTEMFGGLVETKAKVDALSSVGLTEMKKQVESLAELFRKKTADILDRLEKKVQGEEKVEEKKEAEPLKEEGGGPKAEG